MTGLTINVDERFGSRRPSACDATFRGYSSKYNYFSAVADAVSDNTNCFVNPLIPTNSTLRGP